MARLSWAGQDGRSRGRILVDQGWGGGGGGGGGRGEARKLLVSCSFNCLDWTCGQPSPEDRLLPDNCW